MGELNVAFVYAYMVITVLCLFLITVFTVMDWDKIGFSNFTNSNTYTKEDLDRDWESRGCDKQYNLSVFRTVDTLAKKYRNNVVRRNSEIKRFLDAYIKRNPSQCKVPSIPIPTNEFAELNNIWKSINCTVSFPQEYVQGLYNRTKPMSFDQKKTALQNYMNIIEKNVGLDGNGGDNASDLESLEKSFEKCYGKNWKNNKEIFEQYNLIRDLA